MKIIKSTRAKKAMLNIWNEFLKSGKTPRSTNQKKELKKLLKFKKPSEEITPLEYDILHALGREEEKTINQIAKISDRCRNSVSKHLKLLHKRNFVLMREAPTTKGLSYKAKITERGIKLRKEWEGIYN